MITPTSGLLAAMPTTVMERCERACNDGPMRTRLTEMLGIEHPVMLAGMGGVSYQRAGRRGVGRGRLRHARRRDDVSRRARRRDGRGARRSPTSRSASTCSPRCRSAWSTTRTRSSTGGASLFVAGLGVPRDVVQAAARRQRAGREHVRQGAARDRRGRGRLRLRDRAGHRSRRPHRHRRDDAARAADRRRGRRPRAGGRRGRHLRRARARRRDRARRRRRVARHAVHRDARGAHGARLQGRAAAHARGRHGDQPRLHRQDAARGAQRVDAVHRGAPRGARASSRSRCARPSRPTRCTSAATRHSDVDPDKECYPSGQGVGAIDELVPGRRPRAPASSTKPSTRSPAPRRPS